MSRALIKPVSGIWRVAALIAVGVLIGAVVLSTASGAGKKRTVLGKPHLYIHTEIAEGAADTIDSPCPTGQKALGGGYSFGSTNASVDVKFDEPLLQGDNLNLGDEGRNPAANGWRLLLNSTGQNTTHVGTICAPLVKVSR